MKSSWQWLAALVGEVSMMFYTGVKILTNPAIPLGGFETSKLLLPLASRL